MISLTEWVGGTRGRPATKLNHVILRPLDGVKPNAAVKTRPQMSIRLGKNRMNEWRFGILLSRICQTVHVFPGSTCVSIGRSIEDHSMSQMKKNKFAWIIALAICAPFIWLGIQNLVGQDVDPFGEGSAVTQGETVEDPFGESALPTSSEPASNLTPNPSTTPTQVPDNSDPFGEGCATTNPVDEPNDLPSSSTPFGSENKGDNSSATPIDKDPFGTVDSMPIDSNPNKTMGSVTDEVDRAQNTFSAGAFEVEFWRYLTANNYKNWAPAPKQDADYYSGKSPHGIYLKMYLNLTAIANPVELPNGSVIVKENYGPDKSLKAITVMYRSTGYNPEGKDWYWVKYNPDGTVARTGVEDGSAKIAGASKNCMECHESADGDDFTFFND